MKVAVIGSRGLEVNHLGDYLPNDVTEIVSGGARGIDTCAKSYALRHGLKLTEFLPEYEKYGRGAPLRRNITIIEHADLVLLGRQVQRDEVRDRQLQKTKHPCGGVPARRRIGGETISMYIYPNDLKAKPTLWLWALRDVAVTAVCLVLSVLALVELGLLPPLICTVLYAFLSIRLEDASILDFLRHAMCFLFLKQQYYEWKENVI